MTAVNVLTLFEEKDFLRICAPMVRYSKLQFRTLVRQYNCDLCFSPMIMADSFCKSQKARDNELKINKADNPLIVQFAANNVHEFVSAAVMVSPHCIGVDLNCGCPQRWAKQLGLGCAMLQKPENIADLVKQCRNRIPQSFSVSVKTRILSDIKKTVDICRQLENAGISFLTIHARTPTQLKGDINIDALRIINDSIKCPLVANGGVKTLEDCYKIHSSTKCKGVMVANSILTNPTIFSGKNTVPLKCVQQWVDICYNSTLDIENYLSLYEQRFTQVSVISERPKHLTFQCFHHHLVFMLEKILSRPKRRIFNNLQSFADSFNFLKTELEISPKLYDVNDFNKNMVMNVNYENLSNECELSDEHSENIEESSYNYGSNSGKYFKSKIEEFDQINYDFADMYSEN